MIWEPRAVGRIHKLQRLTGRDKAARGAETPATTYITRLRDSPHVFYAPDWAIYFFSYLVQYMMV
jgi:hypothetical protein